MTIECREYTKAMVITSCRLLAGAVMVLCGATQAKSDPCRAEVLRFEKSMVFVRQSVGEAQGKEIRDKLLPYKLEFDILQKDGNAGGKARTGTQACVAQETQDCHWVAASFTPVVFAVAATVMP